MWKNTHGCICTAAIKECGATYASPVNLHSPRNLACCTHKNSCCLEEYHAIGYGQEDECKAFELHCKRLPAMPRSALKVSYRKRAVLGTVTQDCIPCRSFKCKQRQETEPRSQTVVDVNPTGCRKVQCTWVPLSASSWLCNCPPLRNYYVVWLVVSGVKTFTSSVLQRLVRC